MTSKKKIVVIGATGGIGKFVLEELLSKDDCHVVALVRSPQKITQPESDKFQKLQVDVTDKDALAKAIPDDTNVIVSCIGRPDGKIDTTVVSDGTQNIVSALQEKKLESKCRVLIISSWGMRDSWNQMRESWMGWMVSLLFSTVIAKVKDDLTKAEVVLSESNISDYLIVRPGFLNDDAKRGLDKVQEATPTETLETLKISRADTATFMVREALTPKFTNKEAITIVWKKE